MAGWRGTVAQRASIAIGAFYLLIGVVGLIVNPDFGTGGSTSAKQFLVDWNGWHAVLTLLLVPPAFVAATRPAWAIGFQSYNAVANSTIAVWVLFDKTPLGVLDLPNVATDVVLHFIVAGISAAVVVVQLRRDRAAPRAIA
ncbi:MAG TPA: DUF4383 domain-containing protein [Thermoleophilaceae bacterium]|nr:DUF4383 domain-containing protein [Thermoleophilaceae bacterium]